MKLLLDTHIWLWSLLDPQKLSTQVTKALEDENNELWLSSISVWELFLLCEKKRITLKEDPVHWATSALEKIPFKEAPLTMEIAIATQHVQLPHRDPADRFLVATARVHELTLKRTRIKNARWRELQVPLEAESLDTRPATMAQMDELALELERKQRAAAQPVEHVFKLEKVS